MEIFCSYFAGKEERDYFSFAVSQCLTCASLTDTMLQSESPWCDCACLVTSSKYQTSELYCTTSSVVKIDSIN